MSRFVTISQFCPLPPSLRTISVRNISISNVSTIILNNVKTEIFGNVNKVSIIDGARARNVYSLLFLASLNSIHASQARTMWLSWELYIF